MGHVFNGEVLRSMTETGICPIIASTEGYTALREHPEALATALLNAGVRTLEIACRDSSVPELFEKVAPILSNLGLMVGLGTCETMDVAVRAVKAGASFLVSPGFEGAISEYCMRADVRVIYIPGVETYTEMRRAYTHGHHTLKIFPSDSLEKFKQRRAPFMQNHPRAKFVISGVKASNLSVLADWYKYGADSLVHGSELFVTDALMHRRWDVITRHIQSLLRASVIERAEHLEKR